MHANRDTSCERLFLEESTFLQFNRNVHRCVAQARVIIFVLLYKYNILCLDDDDDNNNNNIVTVGGATANNFLFSLPYAFKTYTK
jgi:hypothetical protein